MERIGEGRDRKKRGGGTAGRVLGVLLLLLLPAVESGAQTLDCADCHGSGGIPSPHDPTCRDQSCLESCHAVNQALIGHLSTPGSPLVPDRTTTCNNCHNLPFPGVYHPYNINVDPIAPTAPGVIDLNQACGRCHGGDTGNPPAPGVAPLTKAQLAPVAQNMHADAGIPNQTTWSYVVGSPNTLEITATAQVSCGGQACPALAYDWAWGDGSTTPWSVPGVPPAPPTFNTSPTAVHAYAAAGVKTVTLTVYLAQDLRYNNRLSQVTRSLSLAAPDLPPTVAGTCTWNANSWTMTVVDASTDDGPDGDTLPGDGEATTRITVEWSDGTTNSTGAVGATFTHVYTRTGTFPVTQRAIDARSQTSVRTCATATPAYFSIAGTVTTAAGVGIPAATVTVRNVVSGAYTQVYTATNGTFSVGSQRPATYSFAVKKTGYTFPAVPTETVGPSVSGKVIRANP